MTETEWLVRQQCEHNLRSYQIQPKRTGPKPRVFEAWQLRVAMDVARRKEERRSK